MCLCHVVFVRVLGGVMWCHVCAFWCHLGVWLCMLGVICCMCVRMMQVSRHKSKKGGIQKRVYFWGGISWWGKTPGVAWSAADTKVLFRHTKNLCVGTLFEDDGVVFHWRWRCPKNRTDSGSACPCVSLHCHFKKIKESQPTCFLPRTLTRYRQERSPS